MLGPRPRARAGGGSRARRLRGRRRASRRGRGRARGGLAPGRGARLRGARPPAPGKALHALAAALSHAPGRRPRGGGGGHGRRGATPPGAAREAPELLSARDRLVLARQAEARGDRRDAMLQYGHVLAAMQTARPRRPADWIGERIRRLDAEEEAKGVPARARASRRPRPRRAPPSRRARRCSRAARPPARATRSGARSGSRPGTSRPRSRSGRSRSAKGARRRGRGGVPDGARGRPGPASTRVLALANLLWNEPDRPAKEESLALLDRAIALRPELPRLLREAADRWAAWGDPARALERLDAWRASATPAGRQATDPLREKLVASLARPAGRAAGARGLRRVLARGAAVPARAGVPAPRRRVRGRAGARASSTRPCASIPRSCRPGSCSRPCASRRGDAAGAEAALTKALEVDPSRASSWERLAALLEPPAGPERRRDGRVAERGAGGLARGALGAGRRAASGGKELEAVRWWRRYVAEAPDGLHVDEARAAVEREDRRFQTLRGAGIGLAAFGVVLGAGLLLRRRRGLTLAEWLRRDPGATREVRPVLGRLSHEVFKHGGLLLGEAPRSAWDRATTSGPAPRSSRPVSTARARAPGLVAEGRAALDDLAALARRRGAALNLRLQGSGLRSRRRGARRARRARTTTSRRSRRAGRCPRGAAWALASRARRARPAALNARTAQELRPARSTRPARREASCERLAALLASVARERKAPAPRRSSHRALRGGGRAAAREAARRRMGDDLPESLRERSRRRRASALLAEETARSRDGAGARALRPLRRRSPPAHGRDDPRARRRARASASSPTSCRRWDGPWTSCPGVSGYAKGVSVEFAAVEEAS